MTLLRSVSFFVFVALTNLLLTGCATALSARKAVDLAPFKRIYVESRLSDNHRLDEIIATELRALGYDATFGVPTMRPERGVDAIVSYEDRWQWDFKDYLIEMKIDVRDVRTNKPLATGSYFQASLRTKRPPEVVRIILTPLFRRS